MTAALNDEFQEKIYNDPTVTAEQLDELYYQLAQEYGLVVSSPYVDANTFAKSWFTTNQYFDTPFYAIDYALSGCVAMQFLQLMQRDEETALAAVSSAGAAAVGFGFSQRTASSGGRQDPAFSL